MTYPNRIRCNIIFILIFLFCVAISQVSAAPTTGVLDTDKTVAVITDSWGGGSSSTEIMVMTKQGASYQQSDREGTWHMNQLVSGADAPLWTRGTITVISDGTFISSLSDSNGDNSTPSGSVSVDSSGTVTVSVGSTITCHMESGKTVFACNEAWENGASTVLNIFTKKADSYSDSDFVAEWNYNILFSPGPYWQRGTITTYLNGNWQITDGVDSDGATGLSQSGSSASADTDTGIMTIPSGSGMIQCHLDAGKTVAVCTQTSTTGDTALMIMTKKPSSCTQSDLTGTWGFHVLATPGPYYYQGLLTISSGGTFSLSGTDAAGIINTISGTISVNSSGVLTINNDKIHADPRYGFSPLTVTFTDGTLHSPTSWLWHFGDGATSTSQNPTHTYQTAGSYTVSLTATGADGPVTVTETNFINVAYDGFAFLFSLPDTGQSLCYDTTGGVISCSGAGAGQDGAYNINPLSYADNGDGTVTDNNTGLMWQKQDNGYNYNWYKASGTYHATYNSGAMSVCDSLELGGYDDWRLPSRFELLTLVNYGVSLPGPTIWGYYFPSTHALDYWSSTEAAADPASAWSVSFYNGGVGTSPKDGDGNYVRCIRGVPIPQGFGDNLDGTVTDGRTGLMWEQAEPGRKNWTDAISYCEASSFAGYLDWRLPNFKELESLVDDTRAHSTINPTFFPNAHGSIHTVDPSNYWTSTTYDESKGGAWTVDFYDGSFLGVGKIGNPYVRCVRGGQSGNKCLVRGVRINGTSDYFVSIGTAYKVTLADKTLLLQAEPFLENLNFANNVNVVLRGGYDCSFASQSGFSIISGSLTVQGGSATLDSIIID